MEWVAVKDDATLIAKRQGLPNMESWYLASSDLIWDTMICRSGDDIRYVVCEGPRVWTLWEDMARAPEGMPLEEVQKLVYTLRRMQGEKEKCDGMGFARHSQ